MTKETESKIISSTDSLTRYSDAISRGLKRGDEYVELFTTLCNTPDANELLAAAIGLTDFQLDSEFVTFPHQYSDEDVQLIFMDRMLQLKKIPRNFAVNEVKRVEKLQGRFKLLNEDNFSFFKSPKNRSGFFFAATRDHQPLFYLNLQKKELLFNSDALVNYFVVTLSGTETANIKNAVRVLVDFAKILKENFGFKVDFNILDSVNGEFYAFAAGDIDRQVLDQLFVDAAKSDYMLMSGPDNEAVLELDHDITLTVMNSGSDDLPKWGALVHDEQQKESWLDLLLDYEFIRDWYLRNNKSLAILADSYTFG